MTSATLVSTSCHSSGGVGGGCSQVAKGSSWVGVELPPQLLAPQLMLLPQRLEKPHASP